MRVTCVSHTAGERKTNPIERQGVHLVVVNGQLVIEDGDDSGIAAGKVLRAGV